MSFDLATLHWRGSIGDLATDIKGALTPSEIEELVDLLTDAPELFDCNGNPESSPDSQNRAPGEKDNRQSRDLTALPYSALGPLAHDPAVRAEIVRRRQEPGFKK